jgi:hypothetical protein
LGKSPYANVLSASVPFGRTGAHPERNEIMLRPY